MKKEQKDFLLHWENLFKQFLIPQKFASAFPEWDIWDRWSNENEETKVQIFLDKLRDSEESGIFKRFIDNLRHCSEQKWIFDLIDGKLDPKEQIKCFKHVVVAPQLKTLFKLLEKDYEIVDARSMIAEFTAYFTTAEKDWLLAIDRDRGNAPAMTAFFSIMTRKHPKWLKEFYDSLNENKYHHPDSPTLAESFQQYIKLAVQKNNGLTYKVSYAIIEEKRDGEASIAVTEDNDQTVPEPMDQACALPPVEVIQEDNEECGTSFLLCMDLLNNLSPFEEDCNSNNDSLNNFNVMAVEEAMETCTSEDVCQEESLPELNLRDYQLELAEQAMSGENSLIVAPTGSGKTFVALKVCKDHIEKRPDSRVVFMVPRVPLIKQQYELFKCFLGDGQGILRAISTDETLSAPADRLILDHKISFLTPQILVNLLRQDPSFINKLGLLIFDECHHTVKGDPYNSIMKIYHDNLLKNRRLDILPQIVGLTASPGVGSAKSDEAAAKNIKTLLANLNVTTAPIEVQKHKKNLNQYENEAKYELKPIKRQQSEFRTKIRLVMDKIETKLKLEFRRNDNATKGMKFDLKAMSGTQDYEAWVVSFYKKSTLLVDPNLSQRFMAYARYLWKYNSSLWINDHVQSRHAKEYLEEELPLIQPRTPVEAELKKLHDEIVPEIMEENNPMINALYKILKTEFTKQPESKCIIFVRTRPIAKALITCIEESEVEKLHLNPKQLTGAGAAVELGGMTKATQEDTIASFRDGRCKVIVATSVAEEGLDIKACNLIITYNYSTNEIGQVQRQGRGRAKGSKMIILAYDDSSHIQREKSNIIRVKFTHDILQMLRQMDPEQLKKDIKKIQIRLKEDRGLEKLSAEFQSFKKHPSGNNIWTLLCKGCKTEVTKSDQFRHIEKQHHVVVDPKFEDKASCREVPIEQGKPVGFEQVIIGKVYCKECGHDWGVRMCHKKCPISVLKIAGFVLTCGEERVEKKKWKDSPFSVKKELAEADLRNILEHRKNKNGQNVENEEEDSDEEDIYGDIGNQVLSS
uniref:probable ATP-dependent RNA helicase DHX58 isoform X2 n=1 Tax=Ciona intestinalis TaxID=7719 RepID=UPI00089DB154|nr:probable ATP-dependent RNA helicase DHX58 isoform X2 [Ciona intestinalis]|eukprot:XP_018668653.1 probable ATP-dependent RNA helicase DHX58 isoform X2 [Ciona intestinalis]